MTSPWPEPDHKNQTVMCCLCFTDKPFSELSVTTEKQLTDVCMDCRSAEIQTVLRKFEPRS